MQTITLDKAVALIPDGATLMIGGFMAVGTPERLMDELVRQGRKDLTMIANDNALPGKGIGKLVGADLGGLGVDALLHIVDKHLILQPALGQGRELLRAHLNVRRAPALDALGPDVIAQRVDRDQVPGRADLDPHDLVPIEPRRRLGGAGGIHLPHRGPRQTRGQSEGNQANTTRIAHVKTPLASS